MQFHHFWRGWLGKPPNTIKYRSFQQKWPSDWKNITHIRLTISYRATIFENFSQFNVFTQNIWIKPGWFFWQLWENVSSCYQGDLGYAFAKINFSSSNLIFFYFCSLLGYGLSLYWVWILASGHFSPFFLFAFFAAFLALRPLRLLTALKPFSSHALPTTRKTTVFQ